MAVFPANATLVFTQPGGVAGYDQGLAQVYPAGLLVVASLSVDSAQSREMMADADLIRIPLKGRAITPLALPNTVIPGSQATVELWRVGGGFSVPESFESFGDYQAFVANNQAQIIQRGDFFLKADIGSRFQVQAILGDKIEGHLISESAWEQPV